MLCYVMLYHIISYYIILYYIILYYIILYYIILYYIILYYIILYYIILYHIISYHIVSYHIISYHIISYHIILCYIVLYYNIILYYGKRRLQETKTVRLPAAIRTARLAVREVPDHPSRRSRLDARGRSERPGFVSSKDSVQVLALAVGPEKSVRPFVC